MSYVSLYQNVRHTIRFLNIGTKMVIGTYIRCGKQFKVMSVFYIFTMKMYVMSLQMCFIGFLDLKNVGIDIKIMVIGALRAILWAKTCFVVAILNF